MPGGGSKPGQRRGGRKAGTPNKLTSATKATLSEVAREHTTEALETLVKIMRDEKAPAAARAVCADKILDRGWGKALQELKVEHKRNATDWTRDELVAIINDSRASSNGAATANGSGGKSDSFH
jgi:hypothetical protein